MSADNPSFHHEDEVSKRMALLAFHQGQIRGMIDVGAQSVLERDPNLKEALHTNGCKCLGCIDERIGEKHFAMAGSGVHKGIDATLRAIDKGGITHISSHAHCAAVRLSMERDGLLRGFDQAQIEEQVEVHAQWWAKYIAHKAGITYTEHLSPAKFRQPKSYHPSGIIYYTGTAFDANVLDCSPKGFTISRNILNSEDAMDEAALATKIIFGGHGVGQDLLTSYKTPVLMVGISRGSRLGPATLMNEMEQVRRHLGHDESTFALDTVSFSL